MARKFVFSKIWSQVGTAPRGRVRAISTVALVLFTLVGYQNCGNDFVVSDSVSLSSASAEQCDAALQSTFQQSYYPFISTTCKACHVPGGIGKGAFASTDLSVAYNAFILDKPDQVATRAVDPSHAPGVTGPANASAIQSAKAIWDAAYASCNAGSSGSMYAAVTIDKPYGSSTATSTLKWDLSTELSGSTTDYGGATFAVTVTQVTNVSGDTLYYFTNPTLKTGTKAVNVGKMTVRINGVNQPLMTTWTQLSFAVAASTSQNLCTTTATNPFAFASSDTIGISFGILNVTN